MDALSRSGARSEDHDDGSLPTDEQGVTVYDNFEALVDAQLEKLVQRAAADLGREPERFDDVDGVRW